MSESDAMDHWEVIETLARYCEEWREETDHSATFVICPSCLARGGPSWAPMGRVHEPDCKLKLALEAANSFGRERPFRANPEAPAPTLIVWGLGEPHKPAQVQLMARNAHDSLRVVPSAAGWSIQKIAQRAPGDASPPSWAEVAFIPNRKSEPK